MNELGIRLDEHPGGPIAPNQAFFDATEFVQVLAALPGRYITHVYYHDTNCTHDHKTKYWDRYGQVADFISSIELTLNGGEVLTLATKAMYRHYTGHEWSPEKVADYYGLYGANYSVLQSEDYCIHHYDIGTVWDVSHHSRWQSVLDTPIVSIEPYFGPAVVAGKQAKPNVILDVALRFANGQSIYVASNCWQLREDGITRPGSELAVAFIEEHARQLGISPYAEPSLEAFSGLAPTLPTTQEGPGLAPSLSKDSREQ